MRYYEYRHRVSFEETNVVGNVYFTNYLLWQGRCREMFLYEHVPELMPEMGRGLALATTRVACHFYRELAAFEEIAIRMSASAMTPSRLTMAFQYFRVTPEGPQNWWPKANRRWPACVLSVNAWSRRHCPRSCAMRWSFT